MNSTARLDVTGPLSLQLPYVTRAGGVAVDVRADLLLSGRTLEADPCIIRGNRTLLASLRVSVVVCECANMHMSGKAHASLCM